MRLCGITNITYLVVVEKKLLSKMCRCMTGVVEMCFLKSLYLSDLLGTDSVIACIFVTFDLKRRIE